MLGVLQVAATAGQRLLLQAAAGSPAEAAAPAPAASNQTDDGGYEVSFGSSSCANATGPICYNTAISGENLITGMWVNLILGLVIYLGFVLFRGIQGFEFYHARLLLPCVSRKPPQLQLHGHQRFWGWLLPVFKVSDEELVRSAGLDALIAVRIISFGVMLFLPMTLASVALLIPINYTSDFYKDAEEQDEYTSIFMRLTISNIRHRSPRLWLHFVFVYCNVFWACWLIIEYYKEYIALRQTYLVRCTEMPGEVRNVSGGTTPLLTPSVASSRSPMKRALAVAHSPSKRGLGGGGGSSGNLSGLVKTTSNGSLVGKAINRLKLPRRHASGAGEDFGEFAFRPSRLGTPNNSPPHGSPMHADVAAAGSIFTFAGPSRFHHSRNPSKGSPSKGSPSKSSPAGAVSVNAIAGGSAASATQGLAAALAALPAGSPLQDSSRTPPSVPRHSTSSEIELTDGGAAGYYAGGSDAGGSGMSTPASELGAGRVRRPLLYEQQPRSNDRLPPDSEQRQQRQEESARRGSSRKLSVAFDDRCPSPSRIPRSPQVQVPRLPLPPQSPQQAQQQQQQAEQRQQKRRQQQQQQGELQSMGGSGVVERSISFGKDGLLGSLGNPVLNATQSSEEEQADGGTTAADTAARPAACSKSAGSIDASSGSTTSLLALEQQAEQGGAGGAGEPAPLPSRPRHKASNSFDAAAALGFDQAPPKPEDIYAAISRATSSKRASSTDGMLPAVYNTGGEASPMEGGGEGISARWWASYYGGEGLPPFTLTQSITYKGAVRLARPGDNRSLAANASLFTCLVMDMPLEKLKLRRLGVFPTMWRAIQLPPATSLGRVSALTSSRANTAKEEDINAVLDELERGQSQEAGLKDEGDGHGIGPLSILRRIGAIFKYRSSYGEWRRDVRWAMYNKRVRIATEMFSELFGSDFDSIIPIYPTESVDKLAHKWDAKLAVLERLQQALKDTPRHKVHRVTKLKQRIQVLQREVAQLQSDIAAERDAVLSDLPSTCFFATFKSQQAAAIASQTNLNPIMQRLFKVQPAPRPDDVNWPALQRSWWQRTMRPLYALPIILFFMFLPIGMFTGAFAQLTIALCGNPNDSSHSGSLSDSWYCSDDRWASFLRNALTSLAPSLVLSIYHMVFLPVMVYYAAQMEGQHTSLSALDRRCANLFFYWDVFNIFLGALFGGTVLAELKTFLNDPSHIWSALGSAIPAASNFFINYVMYRALVMSSFRLFYPHLAILPAIAKWLRLMPKAKTQRDKLLECPPRNCRYGRDIGIPVLMNYVMVLSMCVTSPLILPFGLLYFAGLWVVWRYQALYVYQRPYESGGQFWPLVAHKVVGCLFIMVVFTASVLLFKGGYTQAALLYITLPIFLLRFDNYLTKRYDDLVKQVPLMAVHAAGRSSVPADIYTPPPLRAGGQGWYPEWGKVWQHWGIGRYTI